MKSIFVILFLSYCFIGSVAQNNVAYVNPGSLPNPITRELDTSLLPIRIFGMHYVGDKGNAGYSIPISLPPGTKDMVPELSIFYDSHLGNGILGYGWALGGLHSISRVGQNNHYDNSTTPVKQNYGDRFLLDGSRLLLFSGTYGYSNSEYRKPNTQTSKIIAYGSQGDGPLYFIEYTKDGYTIEYGNSSDSRVNPLGTNSSITEWKVNKIIDRNGNYISYHYENYAGDNAIRYIRYTGNSTLLEPYNEIEFVYDLRTADPIKMYIADETYTKNRILNSIKVYSEQVLVKRFDFSYSGMFFSNLVEINELNSQGDKGNPTIIKWDLHNPFTSNETISFSPTYGESLSAVGDYNLDGKNDFVTWKPSSGGGSIWSLYINNGNGSYTRTDYCNSDDPSRYKTYAVGFSPYTYNFSDNSDFNRDGLSDVIMRAGDTLLCYMASTNNKLIFNQMDTCIVTGYIKHFSGDFTGDGYSELLIQGTNNTVIHSFQTDQSWTINLPSNFYLIEDVNGDGKTDLISFSGTGYSVYEFDYNSGNNTFTLNQISQETNQYFTSAISSSNRFLTGDFNGDGNIDFLVKPVSSGWYILMGTGSKFVFDTNFTIPLSSQFDPFTYLSDKGVYVRDINSDGYSDIIATSTLYKNSLPDSVGINFVLSNGANFFSETYSFYYPSKTTQGSFIWGDFKGDNSLDGLLNMSKVVQTGGYYKNNLIKSIGDGYNNLTQFTYVKGAKPDNTQTRQFISKPFIYSPIGRSLIDSVRVSYRNNCLMSRKYSYANPVVHLSGLGFLGHANIISRDLISGMYEKEFKSVNQTYAHQYTSKIQYLDGLNTEIGWKTLVPTLTSLAYGGYTLIQTYVEDKDLITSFLNKTTTLYDNFNNVTSISKDLNSEGIENYLYFYDDLGAWCPSVVDSISISKRKTGSIDSFTTTKGFTYNSYGLVVQERNFSNTNQPLIVNYTYDSYGLVALTETVISPDNKRTINYQYDTKHRLPASISSGVLSEAYSFDFKYGNILTFTDVGGVITSYEYNDSGEPVKSSLTDSIFSTEIIAWNPDTLINSLIKVTMKANGGPEEVRYFDSFEREVRASLTTYDGEVVNVATKLNPRGLVKSLSNPYFSVESPNWISFGFDTIGRLTSTISNNITTTISYNYNTTTLSSTRGGFNKSSTSTRNGLGQITGLNQNGLSLTFEYDDGGRVSQISPPGTGTELSYFYDSRGLPISEADPNSGLRVSIQNGLSEEVLRVANSGDTSFYYYDQYGRDSVWRTPRGTTQFQYGATGTGTGKIQSIVSPDACFSFKYNSLGLLSRSSDSISATEKMVFSYDYDVYGRMSRLTYPTGYSVTYEYDDWGNLLKIRDGQSNLILWEYSSGDANGNITESLLGDGMITVRKSFDSYGLPTQIKFEKGDSILQWFGYEFDAGTGNLLWRSDSLRNLKEAFGYDIHDRLIWSKGTGNDSIIITYDDIGNILSKTDVGAYHYDETKIHAVDSISELSTAYIVGDESISYNHDNLPEIICTNRYSLEFIYGLGTARIKAVLRDSTDLIKKTTWYSDSFERILEGSQDRSYHWIQSPEGPIALVITNTNGPKQIYLLAKDHLGSITGLIDTTGKVVGEYSFDPWGRRRDPNDWSYIFSDSVISNRGFTTHEHLDEFRLIHMNGRLYDPQLGRFLNPDPIISDPSSIQNYNRYSYCLNNPLKYTDPTGYWPVEGGPTESEVFHEYCYIRNNRGYKGQYSDFRAQFYEQYQSIQESGGGGGSGSLIFFFTYSIDDNVKGGESIGPEFGYLITGPLVISFKHVISCTPAGQGGDGTITTNNDPTSGAEKAAAGLAGVVGIALVEPTPVGEFVAGLYASYLVIVYGPEVVDLTIDLVRQFAAEHTSKARNSTKGKHQEGQARKARDYGGEKGDVRRNPPRQKPPGWKGPWPPK